MFFIIILLIVLAAVLMENYQKIIGLNLIDKLIRLFTVGNLLIVLTVSCILAIITIYALTFGQLCVQESNDLVLNLGVTMGTIVAIFFSLLLLPIQQIANKYSPTFIYLYSRDPHLILSFVSLSMIMTSYFLISQYGTTLLINLLIIPFFIVGLFILILFILYVMISFDPANSIFPALYSEITKGGQRKFDEDYKKCKADESRLQLSILKSGGSPMPDLEIDLCRSIISDDLSDYFRDKILPIREIAAKSIRDMDMDTSKNAIYCISDVVLHYLHLRKDYTSAEDKILLFIFEEFKVLKVIASPEINIRVHKYLIDAWVRIGVAAAEVKQMPSMGSSGYHNLTVWPERALKDMCLSNLNDNDSYAPTSSCKALGDIGVKLMRRGYRSHAADVIKDLADIENHAIRLGLQYVCPSINESISRIYRQGIVSRNRSSSGSLNDYSDKKIFEAIRGIIDSGLAKPTLSVTDNQIFHYYFGDRLGLKDTNLAVISELCLFYNPDPEFTIYNLNCVKGNTELIKHAIDGLQTKDEHNDYFIRQAFDRLYSMTLLLCSYLEPKLANWQSLLYSKYRGIKESFNPSESMKTEVRGQIKEILDWLMTQELNSEIHNSDDLDILFSLAIILSYEVDINNSSELIESRDYILTQLSDYLEKRRPNEDSNGSLFRYFRLLRDFLKRVGNIEASDMFVVPDRNYSRLTNAYMHEYTGDYPSGAMIGGEWYLKPQRDSLTGGYSDQIKEYLDFLPRHRNG